MYVLPDSQRKNRKAQNPLHRASADPVDNRQHHRPLRDELHL